MDRKCTFIEQPIIGANGKKKTAEFSYKKKEDMIYRKRDAQSCGM